MTINVKPNMERLRLSEITPTGWISRQLDRDIDGFVGRLDEYCKEAASNIFAANKVGYGSHEYWRTWWEGEIEGNWIDGFVRTAFLSESRRAQDKVKNYIKNVLAHRGEDGYIGIYNSDSRYASDQEDGELWCQSRIILAMLAYWEFTGDREVFEAALKGALLTASMYGPQAGGRSYFETAGYDGGKPHGLSIIEPFLLLYGHTGDKRLLDFCIFLYEDFSSYTIKVPMWDDLKLEYVLDADRPFFSHGVHTCEHLRLPLMLYFYTGDGKYKAAYENAYRKLKKYIGISGACKSDEWIASIRPGGEEQEHGIADNVLFEGIPLPEAGYEYCTSTELLLSLNAAFNVTGDSDFADMAERLALNAAMAARKSDGRTIGYLSADNLYYATKEKGVRWDYSSTHDDAAVCCIANAGRLMPGYIANMWAKPEDGLAAVLYGPCVIKTDVGGADIEVIEQTSYPFESQIRFSIKLSESVGFAFKFRIPKWCSKPSLLVNGEEMAFEKENGFAIINRLWQNGDEILLSLPADIKAEKAADGSMAVVRGPLVYSLPIREEWKVTREYSLEGFCDMDCIPAEGEKWDYVLKLEEGEAQTKFLRPIYGEAEDAFPWDQSPVAIKADVLNYMSQPTVIKLVPIGCTNLRRTCFPYTTFYK